MAVYKSQKCLVFAQRSLLHQLQLSTLLDRFNVMSFANFDLRMNYYTCNTHELSVRRCSVDLTNLRLFSSVFVLGHLEHLVKLHLIHTPSQLSQWISSCFSVVEKRASSKCLRCVITRGPVMQ